MLIMSLVNMMVHVLWKLWHQSDSTLGLLFQMYIIITAPDVI